MIRRKPLKRVKTEKVIGNKYGIGELDRIKKYNLYTPESQDMIVTSESPLTFTQFERKLKALNSRFFITYNPNTPTPEAPMGHAVRFRTEDGHDPICGVGMAGNNILPAQTTYNHYFNKEKNISETRIQALGWVAAEEMAVEYLIKKKINPEVNKYAL